MSKIIKKIIDLILILIIIVLCAYFVLRKSNQILIYNVKTGSMENNIHVGDYILTAKCNEYKVGDVITFQIEDEFITHRIIKKSGDVITTKGDANNIEDDNINKENIVGKVIISGGMLNFIINYKFALAAFLLSIYLFSCYFANNETIEENESNNEDIEESDEKNIENNSDNEETDKDESNEEITEDNSNDENKEDKSDAENKEENENKEK